MTVKFDRYSKFKVGNDIGFVPFIPIVEKESDFYITYIKGQTRLDLLSCEYYGDPDFWWVILQANPQYGSMEFDIPNNAKLRIPYPIDTTIGNYKKAIDKYNNINK